jgi:hypothetical protein
MKKSIILIPIFIVVLFLTVKTSQASILYFEPQNSSYENNREFIITARIDLQNNETINLVEGYINFPANVLMAKDVSLGDSILTIIPQQPVIDNQKGIINFAGGVPNGYSGKINGDAGPSNTLIKIIFQAKNIANNNLIQFSSNSRVYLNDGLGTPAKLNFEPAIINIIAPTNNQPISQWEEQLSQDNIIPEQFSIDLQRDKNVFNNKWFITFSTIDKQTGIDHYEVKDGQDPWQKTESPYLLKNQTLTHLIQVKAVDKARNERIGLLRPNKNLLVIYLIVTIVILLIIILIIVIIKGIKPRGKLLTHIPQ